MGRATAFRFSLVAGLASLLFANLPVRAEDRDAEAKVRFQQDDGRLNQIYQALRQRLDPAGQSALKFAQRSWVAFKERDSATFAGLARMAQEPDRAIYLYEADETEARMIDLDFVGRPGNPAEPSDVIKTAGEADQMLNNTYRECIARLPQEKVQSVKETEALWVEFRDLHCQFDAALKGGQLDDNVLRSLTLRRVGQLHRYILATVGMHLPAPNAAEDSGEEDGAGGEPPADLYRFAR